RTAWGTVESIPVQPIIKEIDIGDINIDTGIGTGNTIGYGDEFVSSGRLPTLSSADSSLEIIYTSPSGQRWTTDVLVDKEGNYNDKFRMGESGNWRVDYNYEDAGGNLQSWNESVTVEKESDEVTPFVGLIASIITMAFAAVIISRRKNDL
ncbi:MAG: hypothetical protein VYA95_07375, partial [Candidatus Thermoplasmatota archaeon]|nr:hypothetical protein [Candidatus Thermoplasmatota archaeon]